MRKTQTLAILKQAFDREQGLSKLLVSPNNYSSFRSSLVHGLLGGFVGALAMGALVPLPDALCLALAERRLTHDSFYFPVCVGRLVRATKIELS